MQKRKICAAVCIGLFTVLLIFSAVFLQGLVNSVILDGIVLAPQTQDLWSQNPGKTHTVTVRNFTFYNLSNPREFVYRNQKPIFRQIRNYAFQEQSNFTSIVYSDDKSVINYNYWLFFHRLPTSRDSEEKVNILNLAPLGFWSQLDKVDVSTFALQGFGGLFVELNSTIKMQAIGQGVQGQYIANYSSFNNICTKLQIQKRLCSNIFNDVNYGLGDPNNYQVWVDWAYYNSSGSEEVIYQYFGLSRYQMNSLDKIFEKWCYSVDQILNNWYCGGQVCSNYELAILQLSSSGLTSNPPQGQAVDSICFTGNISCEGYPQISSFYKYQFPSISNDSIYLNLTFSKYTVSKLFTPYVGTFLNIGNLAALFEVGRRIDINASDQDLDLLRSMTHADTNSHAFVLWQYAKYFTNEFVLKKKMMGVRKHAGIGGVFSQALYQSFTQFNQWIMKQYLSILVAEKMPNCSSFLSLTIEKITAAQLDLLCLNKTTDSYINYYQLIEPCNNQYKIESFLKKYSLRQYLVSQLCNKNELSVYELVQSAHRQIFEKYRCSMNIQSQRCTEFQLGLKQFVSSSITQDPIINSIRSYPSALSGHAWNSELQQWEYSHFLKQVYQDSQYDKEKVSNTTELTDLLSFDKLFNVPMVQNIYLVNETQFQQLYYWKNKTLMQEYIKFVSIEVGFGGFTMQRTVQQLLFGFQDPFLKTFRDMDPMLGGDPSINPVVALNQLNITLQQAVNFPQSMFTGYSDPYLTRIYKSFLGQEIITYNYTYYDGYKINSKMISPYRKPVKLSGTDAVQNRPMSTPSDNQFIFVDNLFRVGELSFNESVEKYGFDLLRYTLSDNLLKSAKQYPPNENYYQYETGLLNLSFLGPPLLASKNHFLDVDPKWANKVQLYDQSGENKQEGNRYDQTQLIIQPKTGATFTATINLQTNLQLLTDVLFTNDRIMLPVFTVYRSANLTEETANDLLGVLKIAIVLPRRMIIGSIIGILFGVISLFLWRTKERLVGQQSLLSTTSDDKGNADEIEDKQ